MNAKQCKHDKQKFETKLSQQPIISTFMSSWHSF